MKAIIAIIKAEPVRVAFAIMAGVALLTAFGLRLSAEQVAAIETFLGAVLAVVVRGAVTPVGTRGPAGGTAADVMRRLRE